MPYHVHNFTSQYILVDNDKLDISAARTYKEIATISKERTKLDKLEDIPIRGLEVNEQDFEIQMYPGKVTRDLIDLFVFESPNYYDSLVNPESGIVYYKGNYCKFNQYELEEVLSVSTGSRIIQVIYFEGDVDGGESDSNILKYIFVKTPVVAYEESHTSSRAEYIWLISFIVFAIFLIIIGVLFAIKTNADMRMELVR